MSTTHEEGRFNLSAWALRHQALVVFLIALATAFGILAYTRSPNLKTRRSRSASW
jgi:hypothetical protein